MNNIIARFDGSHRKHLDGTYSIGIGYSIIIPTKNVNIKQGHTYNLCEQLNAQFAESLALIELLETLQKYNNYNITIIGDCQSLIGAINKGQYNPNLAIQSEYITLLIDNLRDGNTVELMWEPREQNVVCDKLSKRKEIFIFKYINIHNQVIDVSLKAYSEQDAYERFQKISQKMKHNEILANKKRKSINRMIKEFKKFGTAYA